MLLTSPVIPSPRHPFHEKAHVFSRRPADEPDFRFGQQPGEVTLPPYPDPDCHLRKKRRQHNRKANHGILHPRNEKRYPHLPYPGDGLLTDGKIPEYQQAIGMVITCTADKENFTTVYTTFSILVKYRQKDNIPNNSRNPWFIPSIGQWCDMLKNICGKDPMTFNRTSVAFEEYYKYGTETLDKLNAQLGKAGRSARNLSVGKRRIYQTSTEFNRQLSWIIIWGFLDDWDRIGIKGYDKSAGYLIYPFFAF